jgi:hypothetical protein
MGKFRIIKANPDITIEDEKVKYAFPTERDRKIARFFLKKGSNFLFALAVDYPGLYKIPLCYRDKAREEIKKLGIKTSRPQPFITWEKGVRYDNATPFAMLFFLGPRTDRSTYGTTKKNATSFKIWFCNCDKIFNSEVK